MQRSVRAVAAAAVMLVSAGVGVAWANDQLKGCIPGYAGNNPQLVLHRPQVGTDWRIDLKCEPLDPDPAPCYFCLYCQLKVWDGTDWIPAPNSSTGHGNTMAQGYSIACGPPTPTRWQEAWGGYPDGLYRMSFSVGVCVEGPCGTCLFSKPIDKDFGY
jgi:hypothetical protein